MVRVHVGAPSGTSCRALGHRVYIHGDVDVFPAGFAVEWNTDQPSTSVLIRLPSTLVGRVGAELGCDPARLDLARFKVRDPPLEHLAWAFTSEPADESPAGALYSEGLGIALAAHLVGGRRSTDSGPRQLDARQLERILLAIDRHLGESISIAGLAREVGMSTTHLKRLFRQTVGVSLHRYVVQRRVELARTLIARGDLPLSHVAETAGFAHQSHMARWMRRLLGTTPSHVRNHRAQPARPAMPDRV